MKILITGATGTIGEKLVKHLMLNKQDYEIALIVRDLLKCNVLFEKFNSIKYINLSNSRYKKEIIKFNPELVIHLASYLTSKDDENSMLKIIDSNINFGTNLLDALQHTELKTFINIGTFSEYLNNDGLFKSAYLYSASKTAFRSILKYYSEKKKFGWINVIPYTIYGGKDKNKKILDYIISSIYSDTNVPLSEGEQKLDFIHIDDVVDFFITLIKKSNEIKEEFIEFHLGTGISTSLRELGEIVEQSFNKKIHIDWGRLPYRERDVMLARAEIKKNKEILDWEPKINLESGIKRMAKEQGKND